MEGFYYSTYSSLNRIHLLHRTCNASRSLKNYLFCKPDLNRIYHLFSGKKFTTFQTFRNPFCKIFLMSKPTWRNLHMKYLEPQIFVWSFDDQIKYIMNVMNTYGGKHTNWCSRLVIIFRKKLKSFETCSLIFHGRLRWKFIVKIDEDESKFRHSCDKLMEIIVLQVMELSLFLWWNKHGV